MPRAKMDSCHNVTNNVKQRFNATTICEKHIQIKRHRAKNQTYCSKENGFKNS